MCVDNPRIGMGEVGTPQVETKRVDDQNRQREREPQRHFSFGGIAHPQPQFAKVCNDAGKQRRLRGLCGPAAAYIPDDRRKGAARVEVWLLYLMEQRDGVLVPAMPRRTRASGGFVPLTS